MPFGYSDDEFSALLAISLPAIQDVPGTKIERACRMRDLLLALMHAYYMPTLLYGELRFDFNFFQVIFMALDPRYDREALPFRMKVWDPDEKVLDVAWDQCGAVKLRRFRPGWWERELDDIAFWDAKVRWKLSDPDLSSPPVPQLDDFAPGARLLHARATMVELREQARSLATKRMNACYAAGDRDHGDRWENVVQAIDQPPGPATSKALQ